MVAETVTATDGNNDDGDSDDGDDDVDNGGGIGDTTTAATMTVIVRGPVEKMAPIPLLSVLFYSNRS